jgi:hypothetical protein
MKSVLISLDFVYNQEGKLVPLELNTNTYDSIHQFSVINNDNFLETSDFFNHVELHSLLQKNNITKINVIATRDSRFLKAFANYYDYGYNHTYVPQSQTVIPDIEDSDDTLIVRISYDTYALIDDLYARDMYEFHNLIASESFATPVCFTEDGFDTITTFQESQDGSAPNYVIKPRTPNYDKNNYPQVYKLPTEESLQTLKDGLGDDEFITKFEYHSELSLNENRVIYLRNMSLIIGGNLDVLNIINYKSIHSIAQDNELLVIDNVVDENYQMHKLEAGKYYPTWESRALSPYHFDENDKVLMADNSVIPFPNLRMNDSGSVLKTLIYDNGLDDFIDTAVDLEQINNFTTGSSMISHIGEIDSGIFVNVTATNETYGEYTWYDGFTNTYFADKHEGDDNTVEYLPIGELTIGDDLFVYSHSTQTLIPFTITNLYYDVKDINLYKISLKESPEFFIELDLDNNLFLVQHNNCGRRCTQAREGIVNCSQSNCNDCGKFGHKCIDCGGAATNNCDD